MSMDFYDNNKTVRIRSFSLASADFIEAARNTNAYIKNLVQVFGPIGFDLFYSLGQRNISGFIGEIYKNFLANQFDALCLNPHQDGRPDILSLDTEEAQRYYQSCFNHVNGRPVPIKEQFTPFKYGGLEVKCSIGSSGKAQTARFAMEHGHPFGLYDSRVGYLNGITWWAHHSSSSNLLGLYYDYYAPENHIPQIIAALYAELTGPDWNKVSTGDPQNKKTSNTSLNQSGLSKMKNNCLFCCSDEDYLTQLRTIKINI